MKTGDPGMCEWRSVFLRLSEKEPHAHGRIGAPPNCGLHKTGCSSWRLCLGKQT